jgi:hypothetical protein
MINILLVSFHKVTIFLLVKIVEIAIYIMHKINKWK